jgi:hypothetical protein
MGNKKTVEYLEKLMNQLADSVLGLSDDATLDETRETGDDPDEEAERTRSVLLRVSKAWALGGQCPESVQNPIDRRKVSSLKR